MLCHDKWHSTSNLRTMKKFVLLISLIVLLSEFTSGQNMEIEWQQCYGGSENDAAADILISGNYYYILGSTLSDDGDISYLHGGQDGWLIKAYHTGEIIWEKSYGGSNGDHLLRILPAPENTFYLLGSSFSSDGDISNDPYPNSTDFWILKVDSVGNILWDKILGGNILDQLWTGITTDDGGVVAFGWTGSTDGDITTSYGGYDMWMVKINNEGEKEWDFSIGTDGLDFGQAIIQTSEGGFLVGGTSYIGEGGNLTCEPFNYNTEAILVKLDADRNIEWQQCYGGSEHDGATALAEVSDGYVFGGYASSNDGDISGWHGEGDIWIVKVDYFGNIIWQKCLGGSRFEGNAKLTITDDEDIIVSGCTQSIDGDVTGNHTISEYEHDIWIVKLSSEGELIWEQCFGGIWDEQVSFGFIKKDDSNFVIAGQTDYGPSFDVQCTPHGGLYDKDYWVFEIKDTSTNIISTQTTDNATKVYPNPARDYVIFELNPSVISKSTVIPNTGAGTSAGVRNPPERATTVKQGDSSFQPAGQTQGFGMTVVVVNIFGQTITKLPVKAEKTVWDTRDVQNGIYFYSVELEGNLINGKIVIQK